MPFHRALLPLLLLLPEGFAVAQGSGYTPKIEPASDAARKAVAKFALAPGFEIDLFAAEPLLANPVAFCIDPQGRFYVAETFRLHAGVTDNRRHTYWIDDDLACESVADRVAMYRKHLGVRFAGYSIEHERIRRIADTDGDGVADQAVVFADGFHETADGIAAGVLVDGENVWYTCIPKLWRLQDTDGDGQADRRQAHYDGFGVHTALLGHDMHGLCLGPDGKLYFSIGDRGLNVVTDDGRHLFNPHSGAVLRCERDGSGLELFATGLRNPQELAFDAYGNLFTGDNNSDGGDEARWVYVAEGGDSGWRMSYQYLRTRGPWNEEKLWHPHFRGQAAWILPPIANLASGPSGLCYNPGTGLPARYDEHFFLCDFRGGSARSGIWAVACAPKGASFELTQQSRLIWNVLATDIDFGPDSALYLTDWTEGWDMTGKGRIYRLRHPEALGGPEVAATQALLQRGMAGRDDAELGMLLGHRDQRVRQQAQFALAARGAAVASALGAIARAPDHRLRRIHALWALGQIFAAGAPRDVLAPVQALLDDGDGELRAQAARVLGEARQREAAGKLRRLLADTSSRVRYFAALALGKLADPEAVPPLLDMLRHNADEDPFLRHAGVMALVALGDVDAVRAAAADSSAAVRMAALLALRRHARGEVARFLDDPEPLLVVEAARAIHDVPIEDARPALAALLERPGLEDTALLLRVIDANLRLGDAASACRLAAFAGRVDAGDALRTNALEALADWQKPSGRDRVLGLWRPVPERPPAVAADALRPVLRGLVQNAPDPVRVAAVVAARRLAVREVAPDLLPLVGDAGAPGRARAEALAALQQFGHPELARIAKRATTDASDAVRKEAFRILSTLDPVAVLPELDALLGAGSVQERRHALTLLGKLPQRAADDILSTWLDRLARGEVPPKIQLDLVEAATQRKADDVQRKLASYQGAKPKEDPLSPYIEALAGGNREAGSLLFYEHTGAACQRCHAVGRSGGDAGPELTGVGTRRTRRELLEALVAPNRSVAHGFGTVVVTLPDGSFHAGIVRAEADGKLEIETPDGKTMRFDLREIASRTQPVSAMPPMAGILNRHELRDLVEYLSTLK